MFWGFIIKKKKNKNKGPSSLSLLSLLYSSLNDHPLLSSNLPTPCFPTPQRQTLSGSCHSRHFASLPAKLTASASLSIFLCLNPPLPVFLPLSRPLSQHPKLQLILIPSFIVFLSLYIYQCYLSCPHIPLLSIIFVCEFYNFSPFSLCFCSTLSFVFFLIFTSHSK